MKILIEEKSQVIDTLKDIQNITYIDILIVSEKAITSPEGARGNRFNQ